MSDQLLGEAAGSLVVTRQAGVVTVRLDRPDKHNAISYAMWSAFGRLMPALANDDDVDVVVLRGAPGGPFSAGADISEFATLRAGVEGARAYSDAVTAGERALVDFPKPLVALVQGFAVGGGTQLALACDLRLCDDTATFAITAAKLGIVYGLESTARLVETVGAAWARWLLLTGESVDAGTALRIGLVHEILPAAEIEARLDELVGTLQSRARVSLAGAKHHVAWAAAGRTDPDEQVRAVDAQSWSSAEYAEGVDAFLVKRRPDFRAARSNDRGGQA